MERFQIGINEFLSRDTNAFYHVPYTRMGKPDNPDYLNHLKNTFNDFQIKKLRSAQDALQRTLLEDLPEVRRLMVFDTMIVCVVPRAKTEESYDANQQMFRSAVKATIRNMNFFEDGTNYVRRHTDTKTTHLRSRISGHTNDGCSPYPGITEATCVISSNVKGQNILLVDDIYTPGVNIDEDAINALLNMGALTVTFYAVGKA